MKNPIRVLTPEMELIAEIDDYESLTFVRRWHEIGEFELTININKENTGALMVPDNIIVLGSETNKVAIIRHYEIEDGERETLRVIGPALKSVIGRRISIPPSGSEQDTITGNAETVFKHYVDKHFVNPVDPERKIPIMSVATNQGRGMSMSWGSRYKPLDEEFRDISLFTSMGWEVSLDMLNRKWVFDTFTGRDMTADNVEGNPPVIFSTDFDNIKSQRYIKSLLNHRNIGYIGGQGEGIAREIVKIGSGTGLERIETFIDARDQNDTSSLADRGEQKMAEMIVEETLEAENTTTGPFEYGVDWDLGDLVTVMALKWGVALNARITEVTEVYEEAGRTVVPTFGTTRPTFVKQIKKELSQMSGEIRR